MSSLRDRIKELIRNGECIDLSDAPREGNYYVVENFKEDVDYCDALEEVWIWSIGRRRCDGKILASRDGTLYMNSKFDCLWLR